MATAYQDSTEDRIIQTLAALDRRLQTIEERLDLPSSGSSAAEAEGPPRAAILPERESLEFRIGRSWLPKLGVIVFTLGMMFLLTLPLNVLPSLVANTLGFVVTAGLLLLARFFTKSMEPFARSLTGAATLLLFFSVMRLHFFSEHPLIESRDLVFVLLVVVSLANLALSVRTRSSWLAALSLAMGCAAALAGSSAWLVLAGILAVAAATVVVAIRRSWPYLLPVGIAFTALTHFLWSINNPFFNATASFMTEPFAHFVLIVLYPLVFGLASWVRVASDSADENGQVIIAVMNTAMPFILLFGLSMATAREAMGGLHLALAVVHIGLAQAFWIRSGARYSTFFYTMAGNLALSVAIFTTFSVPSAFLWLCLQSFLVISLAIWFRSRFIVVANFGIFLTILIAYLVVAPTIDGILVVFGIVALLSARIMNWQKDRLELKADALRSSYLLTALFVIPYALMQLLPGAWVSLSWAAVALVYYALSRLLHNVKYRWMAITTLLMAVMHVMIVGTTSFEPTLRIISFIVLGIVLLGVSLWYMKATGRGGQEESNANDSPAG